MSDKPVHMLEENCEEINMVYGELVKTTKSNQYYRYNTMHTHTAHLQQKICACKRRYVQYTLLTCLVLDLCTYEYIASVQWYGDVVVGVFIHLS